MTFHSIPLSSLKNAASASVMCSSSIEPGADEGDLGAMHPVDDEEDVGAGEDGDGEDGVHGAPFGVGRTRRRPDFPAHRVTT